MDAAIKNEKGAIADIRTSYEWLQQQPGVGKRIKRQVGWIGRRRRLTVGHPRGVDNVTHRRTCHPGRDQNPSQTVGRDAVRANGNQRSRQQVQRRIQEIGDEYAVTGVRVNEPRCGESDHADRQHRHGNPDCRRGPPNAVGHIVRLVWC